MPESHRTSTFIMMKKVLFMLAMLTCIFASCSDGGSEDPINPTPKPDDVKYEITIDASVISNGLSFDTKAGEGSISFTANANWTLTVASTTSGTTWCKASATSGTKGSATVKFTVEENTDYEDRSVSVTIKAGTASKTFTIIQKGVDALLVTTNKYEVVQEGGTIEVEVKANIDYSMEISETAKGWISEASSRALKTYKHTFNIASNEEAENREGEITFKSGDKVETVKVYQVGGAIIMLTQDEYIVSDAGEMITVEIKSNIEFGVQMPDVDWIVDEASSRGMSSHTLNYYIEPNEGYDSRSAEIIFFDKNSNLQDTLKVIQAQKDAIVISQKEYNVKAEGETIEVKLSANVDFEVTMPEVDWIEQVSSRALKEHTLFYKISANEEEDSRSVEITYMNNVLDIEDKIIIAQEGVKPKADITINVATPGSLSTYISKDRISTLTSIKITGDLNGDDLNIIDNMRSLKILDLSESKIIEGGEVWKSQSNNLTRIVDYLGNENHGVIPASVEYIYLPNDLIELRGCYKDNSYYWSVFGSYYFVSNNNFNESRLQYVDWPNSLQKIMDAAFMGTSLNKIVIPENVDSIGSYAFYKSNLKSFVSNSSNLDYIGKNAFSNCYLYEIDLSKGVKFIGDYAFNNALSSAEVDIKLPVNLKKIGKSAFGKDVFAPKIVNLYLDDMDSWLNVALENWRSTPFHNSIEESNLYYKNQLIDSLTITGVNKINDYVLSGCTSLKKVEIGGDVDTIGNGAFRTCENITEVSIGNNVTVIQEEAFYSCKNLDKVILGKGLEKVEKGAFYYTEPKEVYCYAVTPPSIVSSSNFNKIDKETAKLYVPKGTYSAYYLSDWGSIFTNIIEMD